MTKFDSEYFQEKFPNLYEEMEGNKGKTIKIDGVRTDSNVAEKATDSDKGQGPNVIYYLRLCDNEDEAVEIINYMEREEKIDQDYAKKLRKQVVKRGVRSFGSKRKPGKYPFIQGNSE
ncbi:hypothetical protein AKJ57_04165 [candidate division MSBL1 archaeon SCGC-AAA259A05]|uniref:DUF2095 domain-containing protein n=1 Tax=candidate division MSBL1 archaeon SCGC-AAA259A05 TaxID=1698259 RepID=A0A133U862_9EURY|nr:hypothetical protein AKJ57_04165 [candidate division MSBL1 archaeon SCGC-AAA259A05]